MTRMLTLWDEMTARMEGAGAVALPTLARVIFAATLFVYYWNSGLTKLGDGVFGLFQPSFGAYAQIFPRAMESAGYDASQLGLFHWLVVVGGTAAEFLLPVLIALGLATRVAALGMIGFIFVQSWVDITGHGADASTIGIWFDGNPSSLILDQRAFWVFLLLFLAARGAGPLSLDRVARGVMRRRAGAPQGQAALPARTSRSGTS